MSDRLPGIPGDLDSTGKALYRNLRDALKDREGVSKWENTDHHLLAQTCRYDQRARKARAALEREPLTSEGDRKQLTVHPLVRVAESSEKLFVDGLDRLGFTPKSRAAMGLQPPPKVGKFGGF